MFSTFFLRNGIAQTTNETLDSVTLKLKWKHQFQFAGFYAAQIKGYYKEEGLDVKIVEANAGSPPINYVVNDSAQYGVTSSDILEAYAHGKRVVVMAVIFQHSPYVLISLKSNNLVVPSDFIGKKIMVSSEQGRIQLLAMFKKEGIDPNTIKFITHTWNNQDLINGKADAISGYSSVEPFQFQKLNIETNILSPKDYGIDFYGDLLFTTQKELQYHPERTAAFKRASLKGWEYAMTHVSEIVDYISQMPEVKQRGISKENLLFEANAMQELILPSLIEVGHINPGRFDQMLKVYKDENLIPISSNLDDFIYKTDATIPSYLLKYLWQILTAFIILTIIIFIWNRELRKEVSKRTSQFEDENKQRTLAEITNLKNEQRLELALSAAQLGIWDSDTNSGIVYRNNLWAEMLGYKIEEIEPTENGWLKLVHPEDIEIVFKSRTALLIGTKTFDNYEHRLKTKTGGWKWILSLSKIIEKGEDGRPQRTIGIHINIDELKTKELQLQALTKELLNSNHELEKFAYITSHNLRAPVVNLNSLIELFNIDELQNSINLEIYQKIKYSVNKLETTLNDLIEIVSAKKSTISQKKNISISETVKLVCSNLETQLKRANAKLTMDFYEADLIEFVPTVLESIIQNLITNAIKYRSQDRNLEISIYSKRIDDQTCIFIKDNGMGFDSERMASRTFGLYQRFHDHIEGKGIGLYIIKTQLEALNSSISVISKPNEGAEFKVCIR